ncbi:hypothetical protein [Chryseobacterium sp. MFBS3-17]|uniref:hypothetical protein n=1 Tax=Chryseobacterium sp. MFBS3-17 TaxID=2886689 RepID=UPI001D0E1DDC|nr:hypothetical protein [Chryseobacterium sp. MFBS3-17]MCC2591139.1 hypothetical protein [Chryseobacterium sp. MFBS3-17]
MEPLYSILTFPQEYTAGQLYFNIMVLPRNINLLKEISPDIPAFADISFQMETKIISEADGLPIFSAANVTQTPEILSAASDKRAVLTEIIQQVQQNDGLQVTEDKILNKDQGAAQQIQQFAAKNVSIKKYLPESYRSSFNFTSPRTRFAITDDEYECIIKNKNKKNTDPLTDRNYISWGKLMAFILRNPLLAEKAGLILKARAAVEESDMEKGSWIFHNFAAETSYENIHTAIYAARLPALKEDRKLFAPVLFPVRENPLNNMTYDAVMQESILYNDGFAKIVHANQPVNQDLLQEKDASNPPVMDIGLRLGWDDEQLIIWGNRQLRQKDELTEQQIDAPLGVFGYKTDIRKSGDTRWFSQNQIIANQNMMIAGETMVPAGTPFELPTEVHPTSHGNTLEEGFWLPMYFASWNGKCMVIPDKDSEEIYHLTRSRIPVQKAGPGNAINIRPKTTFHPYRQDENHQMKLLYGTDYQFRIRLTDLSGGGPGFEDNPLNGGQRPIADVHFRRNVKAGKLLIDNITRFHNLQNISLVRDPGRLENILGNSEVLKIKRPLLTYPAVAYTGKYSNAADLLKQKIDNLPQPENSESRTQHTVGLPDPDVKSFKVLVEVKSLEMDNVRSQNGRESYFPWKEKIFAIPFDAATENYDLAAEIHIIYQDIAILTPSDDDGEADLILPTSRECRLTFTPLVEGADTHADYAAPFVREGMSLQLTSFKAASDERNLLSPISGGLRAFYLQPEYQPELSAIAKHKLDIVKVSVASTSVELQRLSDALNLTVHNLTLAGQKGQRVQFGVSHEIRHSLAPDSGSVTLSSTKELFNRWLVAIDFSLLRDWSWNALQEDSFTIFRTINLPGEKEQEAGSISIKDVAAIPMLQNPDRQQSRILFLDSIDPDKYMQNHPRELSATYRIEVHFKSDFESTVRDQYETMQIDLPVTNIPHQIPKMVSAGVAMSPYQYDEEHYRFSEERQKYIWFEFDEPPKDPDDTYYARVLAYAPDPYLCRVDAELLTKISEDLPWRLNPEKIREIIPGMTNDFAGMGIMQELIPESKSKTRTYLLPLPEGLHADSDELTGFFTYEIRIGHKKEIWSTAQGRYGRPLRVNGVQHPTPELVCNAYRTETEAPAKKKHILITATHANAVLNGENITAFPPNTSLWYLLYTQVMQADGLSFRNVLIDSGPMFFKPKKSINQNIVKRDGDRIGIAELSIKDIGDKLQEMGLPRNNNLSVVAVEMFPLTNSWQMDIRQRKNPDAELLEEYIKNRNIVNPLTDLLGQYRIYRSSKLVPVSEVCCEDC